MGAMGLSLLGVVSCGSGTPPVRPTAGGAILNADAGKHHRNRMKDSRIISVNGVSGAGKEAQVAAGLTTATVRYNWPQGGAQEVNLKFRARSDRRYFVKYAAFPPNVEKLSGTTALSTTADGFGQASFGVMERSMMSYNPVERVAGAALGAAILSPAVVLGSVDYFSRIGQDIADKRKAAQWVDMMVISEKEAEGVVRFVRVYPSGKVLWQPWDACSNAPGHAQLGRALNPPMLAEGKAGDAGNGSVFRRQGIEN